MKLIECGVKAVVELEMENINKPVEINYDVPWCFYFGYNIKFMTPNTFSITDKMAA